MDQVNTRHLLRRLTFASTPAAQQAFASKSAAEAIDTLIAASRDAALPAAPEVAVAPWTNTALRTPGMTDARYDALRAAQLQAARRDIDTLRGWWVGEMAATTAPLREQMTLFFHTTFGCTTTSVDMPQALYGSNALLRRMCLGTVPALLEQLVLDPAMVVQIGMDEHRKLRVSDRPAKLILDYWTVGAGHYADSDVEHLSRALTGWRLVAPQGQTAPAVDPAAPLAARRTGLTPVFEPEQFDARPKTILGKTDTFDARGAVRHLAMHPATARRFGQLLVRYFGVDDPQQRLEARLATTYTATGGDMSALLRELVASDEFWSAGTRWALVKSPVHLVAGACRQLELATPSLSVIVPWLAACGQTLFDTPNAGEGGWPGQDAWITPADRLAVRYQLPAVLSGHTPRLGIATAGPNTAQKIDIRTGAGVAREPARLLERLDPAPGVGEAAKRGSQSDVIASVMRSPQYQLA